MIPSPRLPRPRRPILLAILVTAVLAFPMGIVLASHQFSDVPNTNPFHNDIDALVDSGVTAGCGGGKYCPKSAVTREQMAAFLNRLGALAPGKTPVVNADARSMASTRIGAGVEPMERRGSANPALPRGPGRSGESHPPPSSHRSDGVVVVTRIVHDRHRRCRRMPGRSWSRINQLAWSVLAEYYPTPLEGLSRNGSTRTHDDRRGCGRQPTPLIWRLLRNLRALR